MIEKLLRHPLKKGLVFGALFVVLFLNNLHSFVYAAGVEGPVESITEDGLSDFVTKTGSSNAYTLFIWAETAGGAVNDSGFDGANFIIKMRCRENTSWTPWEHMAGSNASYAVADTNGDGVINIGPILMGHCSVAILVASAGASTILNFSLVGDSYEESQ